MNTLQPFHDELDDLLMVINLQARYMEDLANIKLAYTCEQLDRDWARRERAERKARVFKRLFGGNVPELDRLSRDYTYEQQQALYRQYIDGVPMAFPGQNAHRQPVAIDTEGWVNAEDLEWDMLRDRYRMNEPWHFEYEYPFKGSRWRRIKLYLKGLFTGNWRVK